jgi:hypothetical protein
MRGVTARAPSPLPMVQFAKRPCLSTTSVRQSLRPADAPLSLMQQVWAPGGSIDLACRSRGLAYNADEGAGSGRPGYFGYRHWWTFYRAQSKNMPHGRLRVRIIGGVPST